MHLHVFWVGLWLGVALNAHFDQQKEVGQYLKLAPETVVREGEILTIAAYPSAQLPVKTVFVLLMPEGSSLGYHKKPAKVVVVFQGSLAAFTEAMRPAAGEEKIGLRVPIPTLQGRQLTIRFKCFTQDGECVVNLEQTIRYLPKEAQNLVGQWILVSRTLQRLYWGEDDTLCGVFICSTGKKRTPTPTFERTVYDKWVNARSAKHHVDMPWCLATDSKGKINIHATTKVSQLGKPVSHGCIRLHPQDAYTLYLWAEPKKTIIKVV